MTKSLAIALALVAGDVGAAADRSLSAQWPVEGARRVVLRVTAGEVVVRPSSDGLVRASVALEAQAVDLGFWRWVSEADRSLVAAASLAATPDGERLVLALRYPREPGDRVVERWQLEVPATLGLDARLNVGELRVRELRGGLDLDVNVGQVRIELTAGAVRAQVNVGDIVLDSDAERFGTVILQTGVGETVIELAGRRVPDEEVAPPASSARLQGEGEDYYLLTSNVGDVRLNLRKR